MRSIKIRQIQKMLRDLATGYKKKVQNVIKWYEYRFVYNSAPPQPEPEPEPQPEPIVETPVTQDNTAGTEEEIDLATTGLSEDEQALVADIMARFKEAKSFDVGDIVASAKEEMNEANVNSDMSQDELIAAICAPKQKAVDGMVSQANQELES